MKRPLSCRWWCSSILCLRIILLHSIKSDYKRFWCCFNFVPTICLKKSIDHWPALKVTHSLVHLRLVRTKVVFWCCINFVSHLLAWESIDLNFCEYPWGCALSIINNIYCCYELKLFSSAAPFSLPALLAGVAQHETFQWMKKGKAWNKVLRLGFFFVFVTCLTWNWELINIDVVVLIIFCFTKYQRKWKQKFVLLGKKVKVISSLVKSTLGCTV